MVVTVFSPAKINLYLAVTGRRADGYHDLVSVAAPLDFGDELEASSGNGERKSTDLFTLTCDTSGVPAGEDNLVLKAARAFAEVTGWPDRRIAGQPTGVDFKLTKRIPLGAGLGGGSSNAVAALQALNRLSGGLLPAPALTAVATKLGSDCPLFLHCAPVIMRGRGDLIEALPEAAAARLRGRRVLLFKPSFGISTPWAYGRMATEAPRHYLPAPEAERRLGAWLSSSAPASRLAFNNMEGVAFGKFIALPVLLGKLRAEFGVEARMSGSGSACFILCDNPVPAEGKTDADTVVTQMKQMIRRSWGDDVFLQEARLV